MQAEHSIQRQIVKPLGDDGYLNARQKAAMAGGKLPSNLLLDAILNKPEYSDHLKELRNEGYFAAWAHEILVYPKKGGKFQEGKDISDAVGDSEGRQWILDSSCVPKEIFGKKGVGLFVDPEKIEVGEKKVVIYAKQEAVTLLSDFRQNDGWGTMDTKTGIPVGDANSSQSDSRYLYRLDGQSVRPVARGFNVNGYNYRGSVDAFSRHDVALGVGVAKLQAQAGLEEAARSSDIKLRGMSTHDVKTLIRNVNRELSALSDTVKPERLSSIKSLVEAIEVKD
ncbi:MAG: hypothetical protein KGH66_00695 [Candidatus Micrarchaeota archaeon]|nr:hypothetical protein [Candidatus Micrarchaeota archaeon]